MLPPFYAVTEGRCELEEPGELQYEDDEDDEEWLCRRIAELGELQYPGEDEDESDDEEDDREPAFMPDTEVRVHPT